ncbi:MAG: hypothetical protein H0T46_20510 [Deltaproteobacteria bacterium]|nr:hypothetical protein [Deltaproteobacteria bacterium]
MVWRETLLVLVAVAACGGSQKAPAANPDGTTPDGRYHGAGFSGPIPAGWRLVEPEFLKSLGPGVVAVRQITGQPGWLRPSMFIVSTGNKPYTGGTDETQCKTSASASAEQLQRDVKFAGIVDGPVGPTCRFELISRGQIAPTGEQQMVISTVVSGPSQLTLNCSVDPRDNAAITTCNELLAGFKFE